MEDKELDKIEKKLKRLKEINELERKGLKIRILIDSVMVLFFISFVLIISLIGGKN